VKHFQKIDGLRALAIGFVLIEHFGPILGHRITAGYFGVDLFFVISGFLITNILVSGKKPFWIAYRNFVGRRTLRIFPLYYATLGLFLLAGYQPCRDALLFLVTYTYNYAWVRWVLPSGALSHFWSLALEEQFYLFWPPIVLSLRRWPKVLFGFTAILASLCYFQLTTGWIEGVQPYNLVGLFPRAGSLLLGALGALMQRRPGFLDELFRNILLEWIVLAGLAVSLLTSYELKYVVLGLSSLYVVLKAAHSDFHFGFLNRLLTHRWVLHVGAVSYGVYIFHVPVGIYITEHWVAPWWYVVDFDSWGRLAFLRDGLWVFLLPLFTVLSVGLATLSHNHFERPILKLKDRFFG